MAEARLPQPSIGPARAFPNDDRHDQRDTGAARRIFEPSRSVATNLRRPGRNRDRKYAAVQRDEGSAGSANGDFRSPGGYRKLASRYPTGLRENSRKLP